MKLKLKVRSRLPAALVGRTGISFEKSGLIYYADLDYSKLVELPSPDGDKLVALWDRGTGGWNLATLSSIANGVSDVIQNVTGATANVVAGTTLLSIKRTNPTATVLQLPSIFDQGGSRLSVVDYSTGLTGDHAITITPYGTTKIMGKDHWTLYSTDSQPGSMTLRPSTDLNDWYIAP